MTTALSSTEWRPTEDPVPTGLSQSASTARVSVKLLAPFLDVARALNIRIAGGLASAGLTRADLDKPDLHVSHALIDRMLRAAISTSGERALGLLAAEQLRPIHLDVVEYAARVQPTLRGALEQSIRYYALLHDGMEGELQIRAERATLSIGFGELPVAAAGIEFERVE